MRGFPEPTGIEIPEVGDRVILQNQGESSYLKIERASECTSEETQKGCDGRCP
jgi:hypothetical protein